MSEFGPRGGDLMSKEAAEKTPPESGSLLDLFNFIVANNPDSLLTVDYLERVLQQAIRNNFYNTGITSNVGLVGSGAYSNLSIREDGSYIFNIAIRGTRWKMDKNVRLSLARIKRTLPGEPPKDALGATFTFLMNTGYLSRSKTKTERTTAQAALKVTQDERLPAPRHKQKAVSPAATKQTELTWSQYERRVLPRFNDDNYKPEEFDYQGYITGTGEGVTPKKIYCDTMIISGIARNNEHPAHGVYVGVNGCKRVAQGRARFELKSPKEVQLYHLHVDIPEERREEFNCRIVPRELLEEQGGVNIELTSDGKELRLSKDLIFDPKTDPLARQRAATVSLSVLQAVQRRLPIAKIIEALSHGEAAATKMDEDQLTARLAEKKKPGQRRFKYVRKK